MRKVISLALLMSLLLAVPVFAQETTITDVVVDNFVILTEAVQAAGLADTLAEGEFTVFAPTDGAFRTLLSNLDISINDLLANEALLTGVLTYHVIPGTVTAEDILNGATSAETVHGAALSFGYDADVSRVIINGGRASVEAANIFATNGVIHIIDNVLLPPNVNELLVATEPVEEVAPTQTALDFVNDNFVVLSAAINAAGLQDAVNSGEITVFAPTDGAFQTLLNDLGISQARLLSDQALLEDVLTYHVLPGTVTANDILTGMANTETLNGANLSFGYDNDVSRVIINGGRASVEAANIFTANGVVHVIDNVLLPPQ
jgi:transforming growth factor-beta-induced protein